MNSYGIPPHPASRVPGNPFRRVATRLTSVVVAAAAVGGVIVASLLDSAGVPTGIAVAVAGTLFVAAAVFATNLVAGTGVGRADDHATGARRGADRGADALEAWGSGSQLGPEPEQVTSRATGARA